MRHFVILLMCSLGAFAADSPQFRGLNNDGIFPDTNLLTSWPEGGPTELWSIDGLGAGYGSVAIDKGVLYVTGQPEPEKDAMVYAFDLSGKLKWKQSLGAEHHGAGFAGTRSTPTVVKDLLYVMNGNGVLYCLKTKDGSQKWKVALTEKFEGAEIPRFGYSESVMVLGDHVICMPGSPEATVVALNRMTGETVWKTKSEEDKASYCTARLFDNGKVRQIITLTAGSMLGINPKNGELIWRQPYKAKYGIHAISPLFDGNNIFVSDGYKQGSRMFELAADGSGVTQKWEEKKLDIHHGGGVLLDGYVYGSNSRGHWMCLKVETGEIVKELEDHTTIGKGSVVSADGLLIGYGEKGGLGLYKASPTEMELISSFKITKGEAEHWAHPVIHDGRLYIRHGDALMAFDISKKSDS